MKKLLLLVSIITPFTIAYCMDSGNVSDSVKIIEFAQALGKKNYEKAQKLAQSLKDINAHDKNGATPLIYTAAFNEPGMAKFLVSHGADANIKGPENVSALLSAIMNAGDWHNNIISHNNIAIIKILLDAGTDVNAQTTDGNAPLMVAALFSNLEAVKLLLAKKANPNLKNKKGETALMIARKYNDNNSKYIAEILQKYGAKE